MFLFFFLSFFSISSHSLLLFAEQFVFHFSKQTSQQHICPKHSNDRDISLGSMPSTLDTMDGCRVAMLQSERRQSLIGSFVETGRIMKFEGRFPHKVKLNSFKGERCTVVCYQSYHENKHTVDPFFEGKPCFKTPEQQTK